MTIFVAPKCGIPACKFSKFLGVELVEPQGLKGATVPAPILARPSVVFMERQVLRDLPLAQHHYCCALFWKVKVGLMRQEL